MSNNFANLAPIIQASALDGVGNKLAFLQDFTTDFSDEIFDYKRSTVKVPLLSGSAATLNPTTFGGGSNGSTLISIAMDHVHVPFFISNAEYQNGYKLEQLIASNVQVLADKLQLLAFTPITSSNFATATVTPQSAFGLTALNAGWASIKGSRKVAYVDSVAYSKLGTNQNTVQDPSVGGPYALFQKVAYSDVVSGMGTNVYGFNSADKKGLVMASARAAIAPKAQSMIETVQIDLGNGLFADLNMWGSTADRSDNASLDLYFGAAVGDPTAITLYKSA